MPPQTALPLTPYFPGLIRTWPDVIHHAANSPSVVPVCGEVADEVFWNDSVDPSQHDLLGGEAMANLDLVARDERPYQPHDQFQVSIVDLFWP